MRTIAFILFTSLFSFGLMSCEKDELSITPSGNVTTQNYSIADFDQLVAEDLFEVYVQFSDTEEDLVIEADDNIQHLVEVNRRNGKLTIGLEKNVRIHGRQPTLKAYLTTKDLNTIEGSGAVNLILENAWEANNVDIELTGASTMTGTIIADQLDAFLTGACSMNIEGSAHYFDIYADGASHMSDTDFSCDYLEANLTGASTVKVTVNRELDVDADGGSTVYYKGNGVITHQKLKGGSSIIKR